MSIVEKFPFISLSKVWFGISAGFMACSIIAIAIFGLNFGIDFTGGSLLEIESETTIDAEILKKNLDEWGYRGTVQNSGSGSMLIRTVALTQEDHISLMDSLRGVFGEELEELRYESVGPTFGAELKRKSMSAVILLSVLIIAYVAWAFRHVSKPVASWKFGLITIFAGIHDIILPLGVFAILGHYWGYQVDTAFIAAMLTIMGYSINDTIVVFDRTRENLHKNRHSDMSFGEIVNTSIVQTFARSINTTLTTLLTLVAIFIFGGESTRPFVLALIIGITSGAYSSIFFASPLLVFWEKWQKK